MTDRKNVAGFTLVELLVVIAILGILTTMGVGSFLASQKKARDLKRKADLNSISKALENYFNDKGIYPSDNGSGGISGCAPDDASLCAPDGQFTDKNGTVYMTSLPSDPDSGQVYYYDSGLTGNSFQIYARLENTNDPDIKTDGSGSPQGFSGLNCGAKLCNYGVSSTNVTVEEGRTYATSP